MKTYAKELEEIASGILDQHASECGAQKPNYSNRDFMNAIIIFQAALTDKLYDNQNFDGMDLDEQIKMTFQCGSDLRKFIHTYTGLDTHDTEKFL